MAEKKKKAGIFSLIRESLNQTGGCCGPGETCGPDCAPPKKENKAKKENNDGEKKQQAG